ncbi:aminotransferase class III-fold pyridoxal phosphate-dependent enzyme [Microlunatus parietis]|uniref:Adenosylmethionine-8-amino-7-oxononanoate aminotransferase n=1 Tax=Microlunatus parietis TaxID=682979 RepID=A0A7Y9I821_9ACTN|nr:aminotransferase class III-fold pyridoxal phosphate-dependent enzyme [Microlunatus parietis]NYE71798.1 adenosylmethionine-8-amino-7-oxononanoate aminotransferase [Microlunatus parietis]
MTHDVWQERARDHLLLHFSKQRIDDLLVIERGDGPYVFDTDGRRYIDSLSSLFCAQLGYSYGEEMAEAASRQLSTLAFHTTWATAHPTAIELAEAISARAPAEDYRVFFTSGGSEAVEAAWKLAREHFIAIGQPQRTKAIARKTAYHGVTLGALSFTGLPGYAAGFGPAPVEVTHVSNTNAYRAPDGTDPVAFRDRLLAEVEHAIIDAGPDTVAMIIAEPVQNSGGCLVPPPGYWAGLRRIADRYGILLMADEVITGFGRLGEWFGITAESIAPDLISIAKGLTSAYAPMGGVLARSRVIDPMISTGSPFRHGITFGGHPLSAAIALRNIEIFERDRILENVRAQSPHLAAELLSLRSLPIVGDVRGSGFFWAVELVKDERGTRFDQSERDFLLRSYLPRKLRAAGLIARPDDRGDSVVQIAPPLISDRDLLDEIVARLGDVLEDAGHEMSLIGTRTPAHVG